MKKIAWFVVLAYLAIFVVLTLPVIVASWADVIFLQDNGSFNEVFEVFSSVEYWVFIGILLLCEAGLLLLPMRIERRRPVARRHVLLPIILAGFLAGALLFGVLFSLYEFVFGEQTSKGDELIGWLSLACGLVLWVVWGVVFFRISKNKEPRSMVLQQCKRLLQGSVIALLVAVPTHIVARCRDYCCAGFYTFIGITFGIAVMLLSFGPGIYFLYAERWRKLHPQPRSEENEIQP